MCSDSAGPGGGEESGSALIQTHPLCQHESLIFKPTEPENLDRKAMVLAVQEPGPFFLEKDCV